MSTWISDNIDVLFGFLGLAALFASFFAGLGVFA